MATLATARAKAFEVPVKAATTWAKCSRDCLCRDLRLRATVRCLSEACSRLGQRWVRGPSGGFGYDVQCRRLHHGNGARVPPFGVAQASTEQASCHLIGRIQPLGCPHPSTSARRRKPRLELLFVESASA